jgi:hypothetical protein
MWYTLRVAIWPILKFYSFFSFITKIILYTLFSQIFTRKSPNMAQELDSMVNFTLGHHWRCHWNSTGLGATPSGPSHHSITQLTTMATLHHSTTSTNYISHTTHMHVAGQLHNHTIMVQVYTQTLIFRQLTHVASGLVLLPCHLSIFLAAVRISHTIHVIFITSP